ncbi:MAG: hypothetical protein RJA70_4995 [Pseudomonadota bacterium]|jgi:hypothetical protein
MSLNKWTPRHRAGEVRKVFRCGFGALLCVAGCAWNSSSWAQGKVVTISEVTIVGRVQKPIAAVDVSRIQPKLTMAELRKPFLDRIEKAIYRTPF